MMITTYVLDYCMTDHLAEDFSHMNMSWLVQSGNSLKNDILVRFQSKIILAWLLHDFLFYWASQLPLTGITWCMLNDMYSLDQKMSQKHWICSGH
jgi:hypothetical protein